MTYIKKILFSFIVIFLIALPIFQLNAANAALDKAQQGLFDSAKTAELTNTRDANSDDKIRDIISNIVGYILSLSGIFFLVLIISGGYQWMSAGGNEEIVAKAKKRIINATIGLAIILMAYVIVNNIFSIISDASETIVTGTE